MISHHRRRQHINQNAKHKKELRHVDCNRRFVRTILAFRFDLFHSNQTEKLCQIESQLDGKCD